MVLPEDVIFKVLYEARRHLGAHYLHGSGGSMPGGHDGCADRRSAVHMHFDDPDFSNGTPRRRTEQGRTLPILRAAATDIGGVKSICAGRSALSEVSGMTAGATAAGVLDPGVAGRLGAARTFKWPRPNGVLGATSLVWGEDCTGIRHFDCILYIRYIIEYGARIIPRSAIPSAIGGWRRHGHGRVVPRAEVRAGDILIELGGHHIAIAESATSQLNAEDTTLGVRRGNIPADCVAVRLSDNWWLGQVTDH